ncbi:MAG: sporulation protein YqfD [Lachnospiraceae bacterium]|nr:sporulation protein YqfD [Lachnospiraceae bacterium]
MHRRILLYFQGYVRIRLTDGSPERFINLCNHKGIRLWNLVREKEAYECCLRMADFKQIGAIAWKSKVRLRILEKRGFPRFLYQNRKRKAWAAGVLAAFLVLHVCSHFLWSISFEGNLEYTDSALRKFLRESGYQEGIRIDGIVCEDIEKLLRIAYNDITWVSAEISGTCLRIQIKENEVSEQEAAASAPHDVRAETDCTVTSIVTRAGVPQVKAGDTAAAGDLLIAGTIELKNDSGEVVGSRSVAADGDIFGNYTYTYEDSFPLVQTVRRYTGKTLSGYEFQAFGARVNLARKIPFEEYDCISEDTAPDWIRNFSLPFGTTRRLFREYYSYEECRSQEEAQSIAKERLDRHRLLKEEEGTKTEVLSLTVSLSGDSYFVTAVLRAEGPIGVPAEILPGEEEPLADASETGRVP